MLLGHVETEAGTQSPHREHSCVKTAGRANLNADNDWNGVRVLCKYSKSLKWRTETEQLPKELEALLFLSTFYLPEAL